MHIGWAVSRHSILVAPAYLYAYREMRYGGFYEWIFVCIYSHDFMIDFFYMGVRYLIINIRFLFYLRFVESHPPVREPGFFGVIGYQSNILI